MQIIVTAIKDPHVLVDFIYFSKSNCILKIVDLQICDIAINWAGGLHHAKKFEVILVLHIFFKGYVHFFHSKFLLPLLPIYHECNFFAENKALYNILHQPLTPHPDCCMMTPTHLLFTHTINCTPYTERMSFLQPHHLRP